MKITIESTTKVIFINNIATRIWEGETEDGTKIHCYISQIAANENVNVAKFYNDISNSKTPSPEVEAIPMEITL